MAFTNGKDQIFSFVEPGANPGSATGNGLSLRCPVSYSGISTKFVDGGHRGVDYIASKGTPVYAATSGRVIRVYSWQGSTNEAAVDSIGNAVFLEHFDAVVCGAAADSGQGHRAGTDRCLGRLRCDAAAGGCGRLCAGGRCGVHSGRCADGRLYAAA